MTGKASGLANKIKFESGTLPKDEIEPFGKTLRYDDAAGGFRSQTMAQIDSQAAQERADRLAAAEAAERAQQRALAEKLIALATQLAAANPPLADPLAKTAASLQQAVEAGSLPARQEAIDKAIAAIRDEAAKIEDDTIKQAIDEQVGKIDASLKSIEQRVTALEKSKAADTLPNCGGDGVVHRGFEIMGPEGMRPFDQNERVVMAMYSSADPLIATLQEYSSHMLAGQPNMADRLLPLAQAAVRLGDARRATEGIPAGTSAEATDAMFAAVLKALGVAEPAK